MKWMSILAAIVFCAVAYAEPENSAGAQGTGGIVDAPAPVDVRVLLEPNVIPFHRQAKFTISVEGPADMPVEIAPMGGKFGGLDIYGQPKQDVQALRGGRKRTSIAYAIEPVFAGVYAIAPVEVTWNQTNKLKTPSPALRVRELTDEEKQQVAQFSAAAGPVDAPFVRTVYVWVGAGVLAVLAVVLLAWLFLRRRKKVVVSPPALAWEVAYARLRALDERHYTQAGEFEPFYVELSSILRHYIEDRYRLHAPEQTTPEFLAASSASGVFSPEQQRLLTAFLRHSDRVKFAKHTPATADMEQHFADVLRFVDETVPRPEPASSQEAAA
ncbi:MAG TPA: hypothetical protein PLO62_04720 [Candidatus Hydrogenedentes bacterium]|nr:hypothetical protein [Candidatus Hydrogenedentota bacterium]